MNSDQIRSLDGKTVLVKPEHPDDPNSVGLRGSIRVHDLPANNGVLQVEIVLVFPEFSDMGGREAHEEIIPLSQTDVLRLLASDYAGTGAYEFTVLGSGRTVE